MSDEKEKYHSMREAVRDTQAQIKGRTTKSRDTQVSATEYISKADQYMLKNEFTHAEVSLRNAYDWVARYLPEKEKEKYFAAIEKRAERLIGRIEKTPGEQSYNPKSKKFYDTYFRDKTLEDTKILLENIKGARASKGGLETVAATVVLISTILALILGLSFLSFSVTGNVTGNLNQSTSNFLGASFFIIGLIGTFLYLKKK